MDKPESIEVTVILNDKRHNIIRTVAVPRVGDIIWCKNLDQISGNYGMTPKEKFRDGWCRVDQVKWVPEDTGGWRYVDLVVSEVGPTKTKRKK